LYLDKDSHLASKGKDDQRIEPKQMVLTLDM